MGDIIQLAVKSFEELGFTPLGILILILMVFLFTWLFKQVTLRKEKINEEEKLETQDSLNHYCNIYRTLLLYKEEIESRDALLVEYTNSIPVLKTETCEKMESLLFNDQPIEESISHIKEQIKLLRTELDELNPRYEPGTISGKIGNTLRIIEIIFQPIFITMLAFASFLYLMYVGVQPVVGQYLAFLNNLTIFVNLFLLLSFFAAIVDKRFRYSAKNIGIILGYLLIITILLVINNLYTSALALITFFVFTTVYNPKSNNK